jgi:hypothetical protein
MRTQIGAKLQLFSEITKFFVNIPLFAILDITILTGF